VVTLTDRDGKPALDDHGYQYSKKLADGEIASVIAGRLTRELRSALRGRDVPVRGFDSKIEYPNRGKIGHVCALFSFFLSAPTCRGAPAPVFYSRQSETLYAARLRAASMPDERRVRLSSDSGVSPVQFFICSYLSVQRSYNIT
jgi:hypothetical protein